jgi:hypothetical protein
MRPAQARGGEFPGSAACPPRNEGTISSILYDIRAKDDERGSEQKGLVTVTSSGGVAQPAGIKEFAFA